MRTRLAHVRPNIAGMVPMGLLDLMMTELLECSRECTNDGEDSHSKIGERGKFANVSLRKFFFW